MAYAFNILDVIKASVNGSEFWTYVIQELDVDDVDEWEIPEGQQPPTPCVLTLYEAEIKTAAPSSAATLQPEVGLGAAFPTSGLRSIGVTETAAATIRNQTEVKLPALPRTPGNRIRGRSMPDDNGVGEITTRVTFRLGD